MFISQVEAKNYIFMYLYAFIKNMKKNFNTFVLAEYKSAFRKSLH